MHAQGSLWAKRHSAQRKKHCVFSRLSDSMHRFTLSSSLSLMVMHGCHHPNNSGCCVLPTVTGCLAQWRALGCQGSFVKESCSCSCCLAESWPHLSVHLLCMFLDSQRWVFRRSKVFLRFSYLISSIFKGLFPTFGPLQCFLSLSTLTDVDLMPEVAPVLFPTSFSGRS